jgi:hypothetical protein
VLANLFVTHRQFHPAVKPFVHDRFVVQLAEDDLLLIVRVFDFHPHPLALTRVIPEFLHVIAWLIS